MPPMPHIDDDMKSTDGEFGVYWRPEPTRSVFRPTYAHAPSHGHVFEHAPPPPMCYEHAPPPAWNWPTSHYGPPPPPTYSHYHHGPPPPAPPMPYPRYPAETASTAVYHHSSSAPVSRPPADLVYEVNDTDVLCGRGAPTNWHPGNQQFRAIVTQYQTMYLAAKRADKPEIACLVVEKVQERGGRFLKRTKRPGVGACGHFCWVDIGEQRAYEKACQALREGAPEIRRRLAISELEQASNSTDSRQSDDSPRSQEECARD